MNLINRLVFKAKKIAELKAEKLMLALVLFNSDKGAYISKCDFWNGIQGSESSMLVTEHGTLSEAKNAVDEFKKDYNSDCPTIILCREPALSCNMEE